MAIVLKTAEQIAKIKQNGLILRQIVNEASVFAQPGVTTADIDKFIEDKIISFGGTPTFKGYRGFPAAACISVNEVLVHGIPSKQKIKNGDVVSIDIGVTKDGCIADSCYTFAVGEISDIHKQLIKISHDATMLGVSMCQPGAKIHDIAKAVFEHVNSSEHFTVVEGLYGHGTGIQLHEAPTMVFTYPITVKAPNIKLVKDMVITIEPVICFKSTKGQYKELEDRWTLTSLDGSFGSQFEHTVAITATGHEILTGEFLPLK